MRCESFSNLVHWRCVSPLGLLLQGEIISMWCGFHHETHIGISLSVCCGFHILVPTHITLLLVWTMINDSSASILCGKIQPLFIFCAIWIHVCPIKKVYAWRLPPYLLGECCIFSHRTQWTPFEYLISRFINPCLAELFELYFSSFEAGIANAMSSFKWRKIFLFFENIHLLNWVIRLIEHLSPTILSISVTYYLAWNMLKTVYIRV